MRLTVYLTILATFQLIANVYPQNSKVSFKITNGTLQDVFKAIEKQTEYKIFYKVDQIDPNVKINYIAADEMVAMVLGAVLPKTNASFDLIEKVIVISPATSSNRLQISISGTVKDAKSGQGLPGVNIKIQGTTDGTITDLDGNFTLKVPNSSSVLTFSFIGYITQTISLDGKTKLDVSLVEEVKGLDEVVVIGYGTQRKKDLTGSVATIETKDLKSVSVPSVGEALQGRAAGMQIISNGAPGDNVSIRIRGVGTINNSNPLIVIDGLPTTFGLNQLNMDDIESLQVLKDASAAAIYGARGANGVVIVTTKRGKGDQDHLNVNYYSGVQKATNMLEVLTASEFASMHNEMMANGGLSQNPAYADPASLGNGTDWVGEFFKPATMQNFSLSYSGSTEKTNYYVSGNVYDQKGIVINTAFKRYTVQLNTDTKVFKNVKFGNNLTINHDVKTSGSYNINSALMALPTQPIFRNGTYSGPLAVPSWDGDLTNPIGLAKTRENATEGYNLLGSVYGEIEIMEGLKFKSNYGLQANFWNSRNWSPKYKWDNKIQDNSFLSQSANKSITWLWDNTLTYDKIFNSIHHITLMAGTSAQENHFEYQGGSVQSFASDLTQQLSNGTKLPTIGGNANEWALLSYMGRVNYAYDDRYLITATVRRDGSSRFGENNKWGVFPSGSVAWRVSKEDFFKNITVINDLKIRAGYGVTGNQEIGNYAFASNLQTIRYTFNNNTVNAIVPTVMPNPNVQWEEVEQSNIGFDMGLLNDRITLTLDAYVKNTNKMLVPMSVPVSTGYSDIYVPSINAGKMQNKGIEFSISTRNLTGELSWNTNFNVSYNHNEVVSLNDTVPMSTGSIGFSYSLARIQAGHPVNEFYGFVADGVFQNQKEVDDHAVQVPGNDPYNRTSPGDIRFKDINNDGVIDDKDRVFIGNPNPKFIFALNNMFSYKGFDLAIFIQGIYGNQIFNANRIYNEAMAVANNQTKEVLNRWTGEGSSNSVPRAVFNDPNKNTRQSTRYIEDGSYLRIKSLTFGYTLPKSWVGKAKIASARIYASAQNLFTFTKYKGIDPEVSGSGIDLNTYPITRNISFGVNIGF